MASVAVVDAVGASPSGHASSATDTSRNTSLDRARFDAGLPLAAHPALLAAGDRAFGVLREATDVLCARLSKAERPPSLMVALHIWAMAHGIASLFGRGDAARRKLPMSPDDLLEAGFLVYLRGLGLLD